MAENKLYDIHHVDDQADSPAAQTMSNEPERAEQTVPPPAYSPAPTGQNGSPQHVQFPPHQGYAPGYQPQPAAASQGYTTGYQQFDNMPQTTSTTMAVVPGQMQIPLNRPDNFLVSSILSAIFCCPLFGIIGIIYAAQVNSAYDCGDYMKATSYSGLAKGFTIAAVVCGLLFLLISLLSFFLQISH